MNIPPEVARAQGKHGTKGGRPKIDLTDEERTERRRKQHEAYRRRKGINPRPPSGKKSWLQEYYEIWGKMPGIPLTTEEFHEREPLWNAKVFKEQGRGKLFREMWDKEFRKIWRKMPGEKLKDHEFRHGYTKFRKWVQKCHDDKFPLHCYV